MGSNPFKSIQQTLLCDRETDKALPDLMALESSVSGYTSDLQLEYHQLMGLAYMRQREFDRASEVFSAGGDLYGAGYSQMLKGDLREAFNAWQPLISVRNNHWVTSLLGMVAGKLNSYPTFLQIRNHLEADVQYLHWAGQTRLLENLIYFLDVLSDINYESFKFAGRALYHQGVYDQAESWLLKGQLILPNDPEVYFHLGQVYGATERPNDARLMLQQCLLISPYYVPARELLIKLGFTVPD